MSMSVILLDWNLKTPSDVGKTVIVQARFPRGQVLNIIVLPVGMLILEVGVLSNVIVQQLKVNNLTRKSHKNHHKLNPGKDIFESISFLFDVIFLNKFHSKRRKSVFKRDIY